MSSTLQRLNQVTWQKEGDLRRNASLLNGLRYRYPNLNTPVIEEAVQAILLEADLVRAEYIETRAKIRLAEGNIKRRRKR